MFINHVRVMEFALLSADVYYGDWETRTIRYPEMCLWTVYHYSNFVEKEFIDALPKDFFARVYRSSTGDMVVAFRGTSLSREGDLNADMHILLNTESAYTAAARKFFIMLREKLKEIAQKEDEKRIDKDRHHISMISAFPHVTGHSLGGYLAQVVSGSVGGHPLCVAFNAPKAGGLRVTTEDGVIYLDPHQDYPDIHNVDDACDFVHYYGHELGEENILCPDDLMLAFHYEELSNNFDFHFTQYEGIKNFYHFEPKYHTLLFPTDRVHPMSLTSDHGIEVFVEEIRHHEEIKDVAYQHSESEETEFV